MVLSHLCGSPGPFDITMPFAFSFRKSWSQGTLITVKPRLRNALMMPFLTPQSTTTTLFPPPLYVIGLVTLASAAMFFLAGSSNTTSSPS